MKKLESLQNFLFENISHYKIKGGHVDLSSTCYPVGNGFQEDADWYCPHSGERGERKVSNSSEQR